VNVHKEEEKEIKKEKEGFSLRARKGNRKKKRRE